VITAADGDEQTGRAGKVHGRHDIAGVDTTDDDSRPPIDHPIPNGPHLVIFGIVVLQYPAIDRLGQTGQIIQVHYRSPAVVAA
jgi:hypothetical protein